MHNVLRAVFFASAVYLGAGVFQQGRADEYEEAEANLELQQQQLEMSRMEGEVAFQNQMHELELEGRRIELDHMRKAKPHGDGGGAAVLLICLVVNILMAVWVYKDNRRRDADCGIWIVITVLAGFFGALVYAVIRVGDAHASTPAPSRTSTARK